MRRHVRGEGTDRLGAPLLDVGCGVGGFLDFAQRAAFRTYGFDASQAQALSAQTRHPDVRCATNVREYLKILDLKMRFGFVTMWDVLEHMRDPLQVLRDIRTCLEPEGLLFISVPNGAPNGLKLLVAKALRSTPGLIPWEHVFYYTRRSLRALLVRSGFEVLQIGAVVPYLRPLSAHEILRRSAHHVLGPTPLALQIFAVARRSVS